MLLLPKFDYEEPKSLPEALAMLSELKGNGKVIAGGTDLLVNMKKGTVKPAFLVSLKKVEGLREIAGKNGGLSVGSHVTVSEIAGSDRVISSFPVLARSASCLGSPLIRNRATIGGNIVTARPAADLPPALIILGAEVELKGKDKARTVPLDGFFRGPGSSVIENGEVLTQIILPSAPPFTGGDYIKLGHRAALEIAIVAVASRLTLDKPDGVIVDARIVLSAVAPTAIHAVSAEKTLMGQRPSEELFAKAASLAVGDCSPITDIRGGAEYRRDMVNTLVKRTLLKALSDARDMKGGNA
ncbi:MAG: Carbon monoxide dehydrogenase medium chain [Syntrophorhabdus sp. PtaB.Bin047]|nr:MAG: Carbon monoxide dehydrogenase medium chain [Syntrophorhabdus sp. PtaB.Bin047]